jgi:hypothetical protein
LIDFRQAADLVSLGDDGLQPGHLGQWFDGIDMIATDVHTLQQLEALEYLYGFDVIVR